MMIINYEKKIFKELLMRMLKKILFSTCLCLMIFSCTDSDSTAPSSSSEIIYKGALSVGDIIEFNVSGTNYTYTNSSTNESASGTLTNVTSDALFTKLSQAESIITGAAAQVTLQGDFSIDNNFTTSSGTQTSRKIFYYHLQNFGFIIAVEKAVANTFDVGILTETTSPPQLTPGNIYNFISTKSSVNDAGYGVVQLTDSSTINVNHFYTLRGTTWADDTNDINNVPSTLTQQDKDYTLTIQNETWTLNQSINSKLIVLDRGLNKGVVYGAQQEDCTALSGTQYYIGFETNKSVIAFAKVNLSATSQDTMEFLSFDYSTNEWYGAIRDQSGVVLDSNNNPTPFQLPFGISAGNNDQNKDESICRYSFEYEEENHLIRNMAFALENMFISVERDYDESNPAYLFNSMIGFKLE